jgi:hypothetical protein
MTPQHPNSDKNLRPRQPDYPGEEKRTRELSVTDAGWSGAKAAAQAIGVRSLSALIEQIGRGEVVLVLPDQ